MSPEVMKAPHSLGSMMMGVYKIQSESKLGPEKQK